MSLKIVCVAQNLYKILYIKFFYHHHAGDNHYVLQQNSEKTNIYLLNVLFYLSVTIQQYNCLHRTGHSCECWGQLRAHDLPPLISNTTDNTVTGLLDYCLWGPRSLVILNIIVRSEWLLIFSHCMFEAHDKITDAQAVRTECPGRRATKKSRCPRVNGQEADIRKI